MNEWLNWEECEAGGGGGGGGGGGVVLNLGSRVIYFLPDPPD